MSAKCEVLSAKETALVSSSTDSKYWPKPAEAMVCLVAGPVQKRILNFKFLIFRPISSWADFSYWPSSFIWPKIKTGIRPVIRASSARVSSEARTASGLAL